MFQSTTLVLRVGELHGADAAGVNWGKHIVAYSRVVDGGLKQKTITVSFVSVSNMDIGISLLFKRWYTIVLFIIIITSEP